MDTVSQKSYIRLDKPLQCEYICQEVQKLLTKFQQQGVQDFTDSFLVLEIKSISYTIDETVCKLELKN